MGCSPAGSSVLGILQAGVGCHTNTSGDLPDLGIKPRSPGLQADPLPSERGARNKRNHHNEKSTLRNEE